MTDRPEDFYDDSRAVDRRLARHSMEILSTNGPYSEVTFREPRWRSSDLSFKDATKLFDCVSFHMWEYGNLMNCHICIAWRTLGVVDDEHPAALLSLYLNACQKWAEVGLSLAALVGEPHQRRRRRSGFGSRFRFVYTKEQGPKHGFHSHILTNIMKGEIPAFRAWTKEILPQLALHPGTPKSVRVIPSRERSDTASIRRQWEWFTYLVKQIPPVLARPA